MLLQIKNAHFEIFCTTNYVKSIFVANKLSGYALQANVFYATTPIVREEELHFITVKVCCHFIDNGHIELNLLCFF